MYKLLNHYVKTAAALTGDAYRDYVDARNNQTKDNWKTALTTGTIGALSTLGSLYAVNNINAIKKLPAGAKAIIEAAPLLALAAYEIKNSSLPGHTKIDNYVRKHDPEFNSSDYAYSSGSLFPRNKYTSTAQKYYNNNSLLRRFFGQATYNEDAYIPEEPVPMSDKDFKAYAKRKSAIRKMELAAALTDLGVGLAAPEAVLKNEKLIIPLAVAPTATRLAEHINDYVSDPERQIVRNSICGYATPVDERYARRHTFF